MGAETGHRTEGIRDRILSRLRTAGEITDPSGLASGTLLKAVGYHGSSVAFAQLLSAMERDGLIEREIRGKRTYRIGPGDGEGKPHRGNREPVLDTAAARGGREFEPRADAPADFDSTADFNTGDFNTGDFNTGDFNYEELAVRLLAQVVRRVAAAPDEALLADEPVPVARARPENEPESRGDDLGLTLIGLERRLANIQSRQRELAEETALLRAQLAAVQRSVAEIQAGFAGGTLAPEERQVLPRG